MISKINSPEEIKEDVYRIANKKPRYNNTIPLTFIKKLQSNHGTVDEVETKIDLVRRNPLIVALGDSVTAGWFEGNTQIPPEIKEKFFKNKPLIKHVTDIKNVYHEVFRLRLSELYERVSLSVINSGISGDDVVGMNKRLERDVIRYDPDLILINASINGPNDLFEYKKNFNSIVEKIIRFTNSDMIVITPNLIHEELMGNLDKRVDIMIDIAEKYNLCIADTFSIWKQIKKAGINIKKLLSNELNHPTILGHEIYVIELIKLF